VVSAGGGSSRGARGAGGLPKEGAVSPCEVGEAAEGEAAEVNENVGDWPCDEDPSVLTGAARLLGLRGCEGT